MRDRPKARRRGGFTLLEALIGVALLAVALLSAASTTLAGHRMARTESAHGTAVETTRLFTERLRADLDWPTLYDRLRVWSDANPDGAPPTTLYPALEAPRALRNLTVRVVVPGMAGLGIPPTAGLQENLALPALGLPYDLNGDAKIDADPRDDDYLAFPARVELRWSMPEGTFQRFQTLVWLRGERR